MVLLVANFVPLEQVREMQTLRRALHALQEHLLVRAVHLNARIVALDILALLVLQVVLHAPLERSRQ